MELGAIIAALGAHVTDDDGATDEEKLTAVVKEMRGSESSHVKAIAHRLASAGGKIEKGKADSRIKALEKEVKDRTDERDELKQQIETGKGQPSEKEADLQRRLERAEKKLTDVTGERDTERHGRAEDAVKLSRSAFLGALKGRVDDFGIKAVANDFASRFRVKEGGGVEVLDEDGAPIEPPKGKTPEDVLAEQAYLTVPDSNRLRNMVPGGGLNRGGQGAVTAEQITEEKARSREYMRL